MEHRLSIRRALNLPSTLECPRIGRGPATIRDISPEGMRIDCRLTLSLYTPVSIDFSVYIGTARQRFRLDAMVIRTTASGAALMFDLEESQFLALHRALENSSDALLADRQRATHRAPPETIHALRRAS